MTHTFSPTLVNYVSVGLGHDDFIGESSVGTLLPSVTGVNVPSPFGAGHLSATGAGPTLAITGYTGYSAAGPDVKFITDIQYLKLCFGPPGNLEICCFVSVGNHRFCSIMFFLSKPHPIKGAYM
jgi:hypothetical protein